MSVSILILTLNEDRDLADCIASVNWSDDVVVLDSHSTDNTVEVARAKGARVVARSFDNYANQRNFGLHGIQYRHAWVLMLDADERVPADLAEEVRVAVASAAPDVAMFRLRRRDHLFGRWIKGASGYPTWFGRLVRPEQVDVLRPINEEYRTAGRISSLQKHLDHYPFSKGFSAWIQRHDRYSTMEAQLLVDRGMSRVPLRSLWSGDVACRRQALKALVYGLPGRPLVMFLALYIWRRGFLEGRAGFTFCLLRAWYEFMIDCKRRELDRRRAGLGV